MALVKIINSSTKNIEILKKYFHRSTSLLGLGENVKKALFVPLSSEKPRHKRKVTVVGASGQAGVTMAYTLLYQNYCDEIIMYDQKDRKKKLTAEYLDFQHGTALHRCPKLKICMDMENTKDSDLLIVNSGIPPKVGQSRLEVAQPNICHFKEIIPCLAKLSPDSVILVVTNPTDIMTYAAWKYSCFDKNRVIGTGTELDSSRLRFHIAKRLGLNPFSIGGWVIGEHGDSSVPLWSSITIAGTKLRDIDPEIGTCEDKNCWNELHDQVVKDGPMVHKMKGCTQFAVNLAADNIAKAVLSNARTVHSVSTQIKGLYGVESECFMSMPCILGNRGVSEIVQLVLDCDECEKLNNSACALDEHLKKCQFP